MAITYGQVDDVMRKMLEGRNVTEYQQIPHPMEMRIELRLLVNGKWVTDYINEREISMNCHSHEATINYLRSVLDRMAPLPKPTRSLPLQIGTSVMMSDYASAYKAPLRKCEFCGRETKEQQCDGCGAWA